ncbi:MAG TPA: heme NO-binding domain-containing protein [Solirubrobacterales bacterium]|nr:heme NO-binding domain-containing protein [Solirubrobacterales bacterium]
MKGVVFNLLEQVVSEEAGEAAWDKAIADSGVDGSYTSLGTYPHTELEALMSSLSGQLGVEPDEAVEWFGLHALPKLAAAYPELFDPYDSTLSFLRTLNDIIHPEVRKLYPGADVPVFDYRVADDDRLLMGYRSLRGLCFFGQGLIEGAGVHFGESLEVAQTTCQKRGDAECVFEVVVAS